MGWDAPWHWVIVALLVVALFGYKKLPDASRSLGRSLRIFKTEIKGMGEDDKARDAAATTATPAVVVKQVEATPAAPAEPPAATPSATPSAPSSTTSATVPGNETPTASAD